MQDHVLKPGSRVGRFEVEGLVAVGGSAEVYRAREPQLDRWVAIKLLRPHRVHDANWGRRFVAEAQATTRLHHPNIVSVHEVGEHDGLPFLVTEWVEGVTLDEHVRDRDLRPSEILELMLQVADGLSAAHAQGLVHRDLKPANIMVTPEGRVKLVDFGLVRPVDSEELRQRSWSTVEGTVLGTPEYMAPEQVTTGEVSFASDVFSFGAVLYELCAGRSPFRRDSAVESMQAVAAVACDPLERSFDRLGRKLNQLVRNCLRRGAAVRPTDARDLVVMLRAMRASRASWGVGRIVAAAGAAAVLAVVGGAMGWWFAVGHRAPAPGHGSVLLPMEGSRPHLTPDGESVIYVTTDGREIWAAPVGRGNPGLVWAGDRGIEDLAVSADGNWVLFEAADTDGRHWLWEVSATGGVPRKVVEGRAPAASADGVWVAGLRDAGDDRFELLICRRDGTDRRVLRQLRGPVVPRSCLFMPDGRAILVSATDGVRHARLVLVDLDGDLEVITEEPAVARRGLALTADGDAVLWPLRTAPSGNTMIGVTKLKDGGFRPIYPGPGHAAFPTLSADGSMLVMRIKAPHTELIEVEVDPESNVPASVFRVLPHTSGASQPRVSPDGHQLAYRSSRGDLWMMERSSGSVGPFLTTGEAAFNPAWSPDGRLVVYSCLRGENADLWLAGADGSGPRSMTRGEGNSFQPVCSADGRHVIFVSDRDGLDDLYRLDLMTGEVARLHHGGGRNPAISPDGTLIAFLAASNGGLKLELCRFDANQVIGELLWEYQVRQDQWAGAKPRFSPDSRWVAIDLAGEPVGGDVWALSVEEGAETGPRRLTALPFPADLLGWFDWGADGRLVITVARRPGRFLLLRDANDWIERATR